MAARLYHILCAILILCAAAAVPTSADSGHPAVTIDQGKLAGVAEGGLHIFKGIPYAAPPVGAMRWQAPGPAPEWDGVRDASAFGPACVQPPLPASSVYKDDPESMSEDCLSVNVWAPVGAEKAPVIVWIHGGALQVGYSASPMYDGAAFARRGVVFVSLNYRLGILGWFAHPALSAEAPNHVSGNYGLLDQIQALKWVRANIKAFGGDADNVTIMGESAGALSVSYLLSSPLARGLFQKAISESANTRAIPTLEKPVFGLPSAEQLGVMVAGRIGTTDIAALRAMDAEALTAAAGKARFWAQGTVDGWVLPKQVVETFDEGKQAHVPLLAGFNSGETRSQTAFLPPVPASADAYRAEVEKRYRDLAPAFLKVYPATDMRNSMLATLRDAIYGWATERMVRQQAAAGLPAYLYFFDHCYPAMAARDLCAFHASELPFVFNQVGADDWLPANWPRPDGAGDKALSDAMIGYWVGFAKTGVPARPGLPAWKPYADDQAYMHFTDAPTLGHNPVPGMFEMQEELVMRRRVAGQQWFINVGVRAPVVPDPVVADKR